MTRAIDRLIVSGVDRPERGADARDADRLGARRGSSVDELERGRGRCELERGGARVLVRVDRHAPEPEAAPAEPVARRGSSRCSTRPRPAPAARRRRRRCRRSSRSPAPPLAPRPPALLQRARALRALLVPLLRRARRRHAAGGRARAAFPADRAWRRPRSATRCTRCSSTSTSRAPRRPTLERGARLVPGRDRRGARADRAASSPSYCDVAAGRAASPALAGAALGAAVRVRARRRAPPRASSTSSTSTAAARSSSTTRRTRSASATPAEIVEADYRLQRLVYALACFRAGADEVEVVYQFLERPGRRGREPFTARRRCPRSRPSSRRRSRASRRASSAPTPERVRLRRLPGARRRLRRAAARVRAGAESARSAAERGAQLRRRGAAARRAEARRGSARSSSGSLAEHPDATIALRFRTDLELLVSVMLSAQTTDVNVNRVTERLFEKYRRPEDYLAVPLGGARARHLRDRLLPPEGEGAARDDGDADRGVRRPRAAHASTSSSGCPGVARKTANVVAAELGEPQGIVVDTHVRRLSQRLGLTRQDDPVKIERDLHAARAARATGARFPHLLIWHGRRVCVARAPALRGVRPHRPLPVVSRVEAATVSVTPRA